jgi:glycosyltransferase involved in cell wall biosynthesis
MDKINQHTQINTIHFIDELKMGGAQTHLFTMCKASREENPEIEITIVSLFGDGEISAWFEEIGIEVKVFDFRSMMKTKSFLKITTEIKQYIQNKEADAVISHLTWSRLLANTAAWRANIPTRVVFEHGDIYFNSLKFKVLNFLSQFIFLKMVVCSNSLKNWVKKTHKISSTKIDVYHNGVDINKFNTNNIKSTDFDKPQVDFLFAAVGTLGKGVNKRMDVCIEAIAIANKNLKDKSIGLVICGDGEQKQDLLDLVEKLDMNKNIRLLGNRPDVNAILKECDSFCHAAPYEPFGIVAIEALAMKLPVILPQSGGIQEIIKNNKGGYLYKKLDSEALANYMVQLATMTHDDYQKLASDAIEVVKKRFTSVQYIKRFNKEFLSA